MFGRSTAARFNAQKTASTPGPGEYDVKNLKSTKKGAISKVERKFEYQKGSEYAHLGPGSYGSAKDGSSLEGKGVAGWAASESASAVDHAAAIKKLAASWSKVYGAEGSKKAESHVKDREDVVAFLSKLVGDGSSACSEVSSMKEELDAIRARYSDEVAAVLKPGRQSGASSSSAAGSASAWKKVEPLGKASDKASDDVSKKLAKLSGLLSRLAEDVPAIVTVLGEPERERELTEVAEVARRRADKAQHDLDEVSAAAHEESATLREALFEEKQGHAETADRCHRLESLVANGSARLEALEARMVASAEEQQALIETLMAFPDTSDPQDDHRAEEVAVLAEDLFQARARESEAMEELGALRAAYLLEARGACTPGRRHREDESLAQAEQAAEALEAATGEVHVYMDLLEKSRKESRELRGELFKERASLRRLKKTADALITTEVAAEGGLGGEAAETAHALLGLAFTGDSPVGEGEEGLVEGLTAEREALAVLLDEALRERVEVERVLEQERSERRDFGALAEASLLALSDELQQAWNACDNADSAAEEGARSAQAAAREANQTSDALSLQLRQLQGELSAALATSEGLTKECQGLLAAKKNLEGLLRTREREGNSAVLECEEAARMVSSALVSFQKRASSKWQMLESKCQSLSQALAALSDNLDAESGAKESLQVRLEQLSGELRGVQDDREALQGERDALEAALASTTSQRDTLADDKAAILATLEGTVCARDALSAAKDTLQSEMDAVAGELSAESAALAAATDTLACTRDSLESTQGELEVAQSNVVSLQHLLVEQKAAIASVRSQMHERLQAMALRVDEAMSRAEECEGDGRRLNGVLQCASVERDALSAQVTAMIMERGALKQDKDALVHDKDALSSSLADAKGANQVLEGKNESLCHQLSAKEAEVSELEGVIEGLKGDKGGMQDMLMLAQEECKTKWEQVLTLETKVREMEEALVSEQGKVKGLKGEVGRLEAMVGDLEAGVTSAEGTVKMLQEEVSRLNTFLARAEEKGNALQRDVESAKSTAEEGKIREEEGVEREEAAKAALQEVEGRCWQLREELQASKELLKAARGEVASTVGERDEALASLSEAKASLQGANDSIAQMGRDKEAIEKCLSDCQADLEGARGERDSLAGEREVLESARAKADSDRLAAEESVKIASGASDALRRNIESISSERDALRQELSQQAEDAQAKLDQAAEELERVREAAASAHALHKEYRAEMQKLAASAQVSESLKAKLNLLEKDNQQLTSQNVHLVGHQNLKQKIHMHAKVKEENNKLKQDKAALERQVAQQKAQLARLAAEEKTRVSKK